MALWQPQLPGTQLEIETEGDTFTNPKLRPNGPLTAEQVGVLLQDWPAGNAHLDL
jgi:hypothetical protein